MYNYHSQDYYVFKSKKEFAILNHNLLYKSKPKENYLDSVFKKEVDFLAFQEFNSNWRKYLASKATLNYKYFADFAHDYDAYGFGFYSKYPILKTTYLQEYKGVPYCQIIDILIDKDTLTVFNTHLDSPAIAIYGEGNFWTLLFDNHRRRRKQYNSILALSLKKGTKKQIFCGDFNTSRVEPLYRTMHLNWKNAATKRKGGSFSFKIANSPAFIAIDHVFYRGKLNSMNSEIYSFGNSDHLPTVTRFEH